MVATEIKIVRACCGCHKVCIDGVWHGHESEYDDDDHMISHLYCPECFKIYHPEHYEAMKARGRFV